MGRIPVRDGAGRIVDVVDAHEAAAVAEEEAREEQERQEQESTGGSVGDNQSASLAPDAQRPMEEVLRKARKSAVPASQSKWQTSAAEATIGVLVALAMVALLLGRSSPRPDGMPKTIVAATMVATSSALPPMPANAEALASPERRLAQAVVAYAAPDGSIIGALEPGRVYTLTARIDSAWLQLEVAQSGLVWVRADALGESAAAISALPDLATPTSAPTPLPIPVVAPPAPVARASTPQRCTPERVVAVVSDGVTDVWSCVSVADALATLPDGAVIAADLAAAQAYLAGFAQEQTAIAPFNQP